MKRPKFAFLSQVAGGLLCLVLVSGMQAQNDSLLNHKKDSLRKKLSRDSARIYRKTLARPYLRLERRNSILHGFNVNFFGFLAGACLHDRHIVSAGFYEIDKQSKRAEVSLGSGNLQQFASLSVIDFSYQYIFVSRRYIQLQWPIEFGYGSYKAALKAPSGILRHEEGHFVPVGTGIQFIIRPFRGAGMSLIVGYRYARNEPVGIKFNGMYSAFGLWVDARQLYRDFRYYHARKKYKRSLTELEHSH